MAGNDFGGEMRVRLADGSNLTLRGAFTLMTARYSTETVTNQNGDVDRVATPRPRRAEASFKDEGQDFDALLSAPRQDFYIVEEFSGRSHIFADAMIVGDVSQNRANGEVTGLAIEGRNYQSVA